MRRLQKKYRTTPKTKSWTTLIKTAYTDLKVPQQEGAMSRHLSNLYLSVIAFSCASAVLGQSNFEYKITHKNESRDQDALIITKDGNIIEGPSAYILNIEFQKDFNLDGIMDALISTSGGGNCCPSTYMFVTVAEGKAVTAELDDEWADYSLIEQDGQLLVEQKTEDLTNTYKFDGKTAIKLNTAKKPVLKTIAEVHGVGPMYTGNEESKILRADLNMDGKQEKIECAIWPRWGTISCYLPLPANSTYSTENCDRVGVLESTRNGYRELVCNNDRVIYFDGKKWIMQEDK
jgi:hypothetical protein